MASLLFLNPGDQRKFLIRLIRASCLIKNFHRNPVSRLRDTASKCCYTTTSNLKGISSESRTPGVDNLSPDGPHVMNGHNNHHPVTYQNMVNGIKNKMRNSSTTLNPKQEKIFSSETFSYDFWWKSKEGLPLRSMNEIRVPLIKNSLAPNDDKKSPSGTKPLYGLKIIDIGSGGGILTEPLARMGAVMTGIDPIQQNIDISQRHLNESSPDIMSSVSYVRSKIEEFSSDTTNHSKYDAIIASEVLEHVDDVELFLKSSVDVLKPKGKMIITTINQTLASQMFAVFAAENILRIVPKGTHEYQNLIPLNGLILLLQSLDFSIESIHGLTYNIFTGKWSFSNSTLMNYAVVAVKQ